MARLTTVFATASRHIAKEETANEKTASRGWALENTGKKEKTGAAGIGLRGVPRDDYEALEARPRWLTDLGLPTPLEPSAPKGVGASRTGAHPGLSAGLDLGGLTPPTRYGGLFGELVQPSPHASPGGAGRLAPTPFGTAPSNGFVDERLADGGEEKGLGWGSAVDNFVQNGRDGVEDSPLVQAARRHAVRWSGVETASKAADTAVDALDEENEVEANLEKDVRAAGEVVGTVVGAIVDAVTTAVEWVASLFSSGGEESSGTESTAAAASEPEELGDDLPSDDETTPIPPDAEGGGGAAGGIEWVRPGTNPDFVKGPVDPSPEGTEVPAGKRERTWIDERVINPTGNDPSEEGRELRDRSAVGPIDPTPPLG